MSADTGFRFGTKPDMWPKGGEWVYVRGEHAAYDKIRSNQHKLDLFDAALLRIDTNLQALLDLVRLLRAMLLGGHVRRDKLASTSEKLGARDDPETALQRLEDIARQVTWH